MDDVVLRPRFRIVRRIARGGMGSIYLAEQVGVEGFRKTVALKTIRASLVEDQETLDLFMGEARLLADMIHENLLQVFHLDRYEGNYYIVMEYVAGKNLELFLKRHRALDRPVPIRLAAFVASQICRGLDYVHTKRDRGGRHLGIVHRDVSPSNIIISFSGIAKLADFGIAKGLGLKTPAEDEVIMGKYPFMSPEMVRYEGTDARSDVFSLGLVTYELLTGRMVYNVQTAEELIDKMETRRIPNVMRINADVDDELNDIVMRAVELDPDQRWQTAAEFQRALDGYLAGGPKMPTREQLAEHLDAIFPGERERSFW